MNWYLVEAVNVCFEFMIVFIYFSGLLPYKGLKRSIIALIYTLGGIILFTTGLFTSDQLILITVTFTVLVIIANTIYRVKFAKSIFYSALFVVLIFIAEIIFISLMTIANIGLPKDILTQGTSRIIGMIGTKIIYFWFVVYNNRLVKKKDKEIPGSYWLLIILMPVLSSLILYVTLYSLLNSQSHQGIMLYVFCVAGLLYINWAVFDLIESYSNKLRLSIMEQILAHEERNYKLLQESYNQLRELKHDIRNQINVIAGLININQKDMAEESLHALENELRTNEAVYYTGEAIIDSLINIKAQYAKELGINFDAHIFIKAIYLNKIELARLLGNALDNSIEACERNRKENSEIFVRINEIENKLAIMIKNTSDYVDVNNMVTKKSNPLAHGIGMKSIEASVDRIGGIMNYNYNDGMFVLSVLLDNSKND